MPITTTFSLVHDKITILLTSEHIEVVMRLGKTLA